MSVNATLKNTSLLIKIMAVAGIKPGAFWLQDTFCNLLATFTDSILAPRWRGSCFRRPWQRRARRCGWTSAMCLSRWTHPVTAPSSSSPWLSTTSLMTTAPSGPGQLKVDHDPYVKWCGGPNNQISKRTMFFNTIFFFFFLHIKHTVQFNFISLQKLIPCRSVQGGSKTTWRQSGSACRK